MLQQSALTLALLYDTPLAHSPFYGNDRVRGWALAGIRFWANIQHSDGAFDEYYPWEHGYIPTSFSLHAIAEACRLLECDDDQVLQACRRAARYLMHNEERQALNQEAASIPGLYATYLLTGEAWIKEAAIAKFERFIQRQSPDGFFPEYGGADLGYLSTTLDFLLEYARLSNDDRAWDIAEKITNFCSYFVHQDGSVGGQYGSRNTEYFLLSPLCLLADQSAIARAMLRRLRTGDGGVLAWYKAFDDRYLCHNMLHSLLRAVRYAPKDEGEECLLPCDREHERYFEDAGLLSVQEHGAHLVCGLSKGGVMRLFYSGREIFSDYGYRLKGSEGTPSASNWLHAEAQRGSVEDGYYVKSTFAEVPRQRITPLKHMGLRVMARLWGKRLIPVLKRRLIFVDRSGPGHFSRKVNVEQGMLHIEDNLTVERESDQVYWADKYSLRHVASSKYHSADELSERPPLEWRGKGTYCRKRRVDLRTGQVHLVEGNG